MTTGKEMWLTEDVVRLIAQAHDMDEIEVVDEEDDVHPPPPPGVSKLTETKPEDTDCSTNFTKIV